MYGTNANFTIYHTARGRDVSAYSPAVIDAAGLVGSQSLDGRYRGGFSGEKTDRREQDNEWPRTGASDENGDPIASDEIPIEVENATYELMLQELISPGALSINFTPSPFTKVSVDGAADVEYSQFSGSNEAQTSFHIVDELIAPLIVGFSNGLSGDVVR